MKNEVKKVKLLKVSVMCDVISDGYMGGKTIKAGSKHLYQGVLKDGKLPLWLDANEKALAEAIKIGEAEEKKEAPKAKPAAKPAAPANSASQVI